MVPHRTDTNRVLVLIDLWVAGSDIRGDFSQSTTTWNIEDISTITGALQRQ